MVTRRHFVSLVGSALATTAGCLDRSSAGIGRSTADSTPKTVADGPRTTPGDVPEWTPDWTMSFDDWTVLGLDIDDDDLFATLSEDNGPSAVAAVDPADRSVLWRTESEGEAVSLGYAGNHRRGQWGVTLAEDSVYAVAGPAEERQWSAVHALDRGNGDRRWSFDRERRLVVAGVRDGLVVATATEFFPSPGETPTSHQTPESPLSTVVYGLDAADGSVRWEREFRGVTDVAVDADGVFVAREAGLVGLDSAGETRFTYDRAAPQAVAAADGRIFYLTGEDEGATLHGVAPDGDADWRHQLPIDSLLLDGDRCYGAGDAVVAVESDGTVAWRDDDYGRWLVPDPDGDTLYARSGAQADAATAYDATGAERWTFDPPSTNAWPEAATSDALAATAITGEHADEPFYTVYAVNADGEATAALERDSVFDAVGTDGTIYLADGESELLALDP